MRQDVDMNTKQHAELMAVMLALALTTVGFTALALA